MHKLRILNQKLINLGVLLRRATAIGLVFTCVSLTMGPVDARTLMANVDDALTSATVAMTNSADFFKPRSQVFPRSMPTPRARGLAQKVMAMLAGRHSSYYVRPTNSTVIDWHRALRDPRAYATKVIRSGAAARRSSLVIKTPANSGIVQASQASLTGTFAWWQYQSAPLPGIGSASVNLSNGNLLIRSKDMAVAHKGIAFEFVRTFNSNSHHDALGSDGSQPSVFGNGWTNNFDSHLANNNLGGISVYGPDGARFDYTPSTSASYPTGWMPPPGVFDQLSLNSDGTYDLTATTGNIMRFYPPSGTGCPTAAVCGRLQYIYGRNHFTFLSFAYAFSQSSEAMNSMTEIAIAGEDGEKALLELTSTPNGPLVSQLIWPGGQTVSYGYDSSGNLNAVDEVTNGNDWIPQLYTYSGTQLTDAADPRYSNSPGTGPCKDGNYEQFNYDGSGRVASFQANGSVNTNPSDGTSALLQPSAPTGCVQFLEGDLTYNGASTRFTDTNGHVATYTMDSIGRVTSATPFGDTGSPATHVTWGVNNKIVALTDANGAQRYYAYDSNGNQVAESFPKTPTSGGTINPTLTMQFDAYSNIIATCDAVWNAAHGTSWSGSGTPASCQAQNGVPQSQWSTTSYEPYGELIATTSARGYKRSIAYGVNDQNGADYGLPTSITGTSIAEADGSTVSPSESFSYDAHGNRLAYNFGLGSWYFTYDSSNRIVTARDPDGFLAYASWFPNGQQMSHESAYQYALEKQSSGSGAVQSTYDVDGNTTSVTHHFGYRAGTTSYFYDAANRLIESAQPYDASSDQSSGRAFMTRYLYDNSQGGTQKVSIAYNNASLSAHGNFYCTQFFDTTGAGWQADAAYASDAQDRVTERYSNAPGHSAMSTETWTYGTSAPNVDELTSSINAVGITAKYAYTPMDQVTSVAYNDGSTPSSQMTYDADGRLTSVARSDIGTESYGYDAEGNIASQVEPGTGLSSSATYTFGTDLDGARNSLSISSSALSVANLFRYVHRVDGRQTKQLVNFTAGGRATQTFGWSYSAAGRLNKTSDDEQSTNLSYDTNGVLTTDAMPGTKLSYSFDPEGLVTGVISTNQANNVQYTLNNRGEVAQTNLGVSTVDVEHQNSGMQFPGANNTFDTPVVGPSYDSLDSAKLSQTVKNATEYASQATIQTAWSYDAAGRVTAQSEKLSNNSSFPATNSIAYSYDASDHMTQISCNVNTNVCPYGTVAYQYNADGDVVSASGDKSRSFAPYNGGKETMHWADGELLFTTNNAGKLDDLKISTTADITLLTSTGAASTKITYWDRDYTGDEVSWHGGGAVGSSVNPGDPIKGYAALPTGTARGLFYISQQRTDGYSDGANVFQGDRVSNSRLGHWMSKDANLGDFTHPITLKPYVLDGNNSQSLTDPSGQDPSGNCQSSYCASSQNGSSSIGISLPGAAAVVSELITLLGKGLGAVFNGIGSLFSGLFGGGHHSSPPPIVKSPNIGILGYPVDDSIFTAEVHGAAAIGQGYVGAGIFFVPGIGEIEGVGVGAYAAADVEEGSIVAGSPFRVLAHEKVEIDRIGKALGCHACGSFDPGKFGRFIGDHQPPTSLRMLFRQVQRLYPHCLACSNRQGGLVAGILRKLKQP